MDGVQASIASGLEEFRETRRSRAAFFSLPHSAADRTRLRGAHVCHRHIPPSSLPPTATCFQLAFISHSDPEPCVKFPLKFRETHAMSFLGRSGAPSGSVNPERVEMAMQECVCLFFAST